MKKRLQHRSFSCECCEIFKNSHFEKQQRTAASLSMISWKVETDFDLFKASVPILQKPVKRLFSI